VLQITGKKKLGNCTVPLVQQLAVHLLLVLHLGEILFIAENAIDDLCKAERSPLKE